MRVVVIHYDLLEAQPICDRIRREGVEASAYPVRGTAGFRSLSADPPDAIVIDLMRLPSYGRAMGALLRERKSTRQIPLVFITGDPEKTQKARDLLPDATFVDLLRLGPAIQRAVKATTATPVVPDSLFGTPLLQKLRIREGSIVTLLHAPEGFEEKLTPLPEGARFESRMRDANVVLLFVKSAAALGRELPALAREIRKGLMLWVCWPKKSGSLAGSLTMLGIREMCQALGLTDYKACALDKNWSATAVAVRRRR
ncbi:MAG TPA: hypothetical protein VKU19_00880 [Bryobacteraceae bacterium]|nr:hypothetical protein [Bryobacteraceae bacterium]